MSQPKSNNPSSSRYTFDAAVKQIKLIRKEEQVICRDDSMTTFLTHGKKQPHCYVLLHGYTNSPRQFILLAKYLHRRGHNVFIPRLPHHGLKDRMSADIKMLRSQELIDFTDQSINLAQGLGDNITIIGISAGGVMAARAVLHRADVERVVLISPAFGFARIPLWLTNYYIKISQNFPNSFMWWDPRVKEKLLPQHAYPRFSVLALAEIFKVGHEVIQQVRVQKPRVPHLVLITSGFDNAIHLPTAEFIAEIWKSQSKSLIHFHFPTKFKVWHDMIDPGQTYQKVTLTYPIILKILGETD